jgi:hypothetical protein
MSRVQLSAKDIAPLLRAYYALPDPPGYVGAHGLGGAVHIITEDGNIADSNCRWCYEAAMKQGDLAGAALALLILSMSRTQRAKLEDFAFYP